MKVNCGETWEEKKARLFAWHRFFCLWPRRVGPGDCRWLEYIWRRGTFVGVWDPYWEWEYKAIDSHSLP